MKTFPELAPDESDERTCTTPVVPRTDPPELISTRPPVPAFEEEEEPALTRTWLPSDSPLDPLIRLRDPALIPLSPDNTETSPELECLDSPLDNETAPLFPEVVEAEVTLTPPLTEDAEIEEGAPDSRRRAPPVTTACPARI